MAGESAYRFSEDLKTLSKCPNNMNDIPDIRTTSGTAFLFKGIIHYCAGYRSASWGGGFAESCR